MMHGPGELGGAVTYEEHGSARGSRPASETARARRAIRRVVLVYALFSAAWILSSDLAVLISYPDNLPAVLASLAKGTLYVLVSSGLLYLLLRHHPAPADAAGHLPADPSSRLGWRALARVLVPFATLAVLLLLAAEVLFLSDSRQDRERAHGMLRAQAVAKAEELGLSLEQKRRAASAYSQSPQVRQAIAAVLQGDEAARGQLRVGLEEFRRGVDVDAVLLLDAIGATLATAVSPGTPLADLPTAAAAVAAGNAAQLDRLQRVVLDHLVPVLLDRRDGPAPAVLVLREDAERALLPRVQRWPVESASGESYVARRVGSRIEFIGRLRDGGRFPPWASLDDGERASVQLFRGLDFVEDGIDYRGLPVLAAAHAVPGTDWRLIVKIDREEVVGPSRRQTLYFSTILIGFTFLAAIAAWTLWRQQAGLAALHERALLAERETLGRQLDLLSRHANDIILLLDAEGRVLEANERAIDAYGYDAAHLVGMNAGELRPAAEAANFSRYFSQTLSEGHGIFESVHSRADGSSFPVEISARRIDVGDTVRVQAIIRDISERKRAEATLRESEARFRAMIEQSISGTCIIDAAGVLVYVNPRLAEILGCPGWQEMTGRPVLEFVAPEYRELLRGNIRERIAGIGQAARYTFEALRKDGSTVTLGAHGAAGIYRGSRVIIATVQDLTEVKRAEDRAQRYVERLERTVRSTIEVVSAIGEMRDPYTAGHERRVGELAAAIAGEMGLETELVEGLRVAGYLHDVGKMGIPAEILAKPSRLSQAELELVHQHAQQSYEILKRFDFPWPVARIAWQHHERMDGSGYPQGLKGDAILMEARILAVADTIEAMSSHRPYRPGLGLESALKEISDGRGTLYDADVTDAALRLFLRKNYEIPA